MISVLLRSQELFKEDYWPFFSHGRHASFVCLYYHLAPAFYLMLIEHSQAQLCASDGENKTPREGLSNGLLWAPMSRTFRRSGIC